MSAQGGRDRQSLFGCKFTTRSKFTTACYFWYGGVLWAVVLYMKNPCRTWILPSGRLKGSRYRGVSQLHCRLSRYNGPST